MADEPQNCASSDEPPSITCVVCGHSEEDHSQLSTGCYALPHLGCACSGFRANEPPSYPLTLMTPLSDFRVQYRILDLGFTQGIATRWINFGMQMKYTTVGGYLSADDEELLGRNVGFGKRCLEITHVLRGVLYEDVDESSSDSPMRDPVPLTDAEWEPFVWWRVLAADGSLWCETSDEREARESMRPGHTLWKQWRREEMEWRPHA